MTNPAEGINFTEKVRGDNEAEYLWGSSAMLFARNLVRSFENSGWCQHIRGAKGGGLVDGPPVHVFNLRGEDELVLPVEISMPDFREYELANSGFIPLIHKKGSADAVFFSAQSLKKPTRFKDPKDSENSQLVTNLSYTYSISRIAHYLKCIMRDNIGSTANAQYIYSADRSVDLRLRDHAGEPRRSHAALLPVQGLQPRRWRRCRARWAGTTAISRSSRISSSKAWMWTFASMRVSADEV